MVAVMSHPMPVSNDYDGSRINPGIKSNGRIIGSVTVGIPVRIGIVRISVSRIGERNSNANPNANAGLRFWSGDKGESPDYRGNQKKFLPVHNFTSFPKKT
jgi:hypothetical protein